MKKICVIFTLLLFGTGSIAVAGSGRESKQLPPQEVEIMYSSEDHAYQAKDINDVVRWKVLPDGSTAIYNTSGTTVQAIDGATGKPILSKASYAMATFADNSVTSYQAASTYNLYLIDTVGFKYGSGTFFATGASFYLPAGSAALDGFCLRLVDISASGTTDILVVPANDVVLKSGITDFIIDVTGTTGTPGNATASAFSYNVLDAQWEAIEYVYRYAIGGGTWYQKDAK